jgi:hypothetical protein
MYWVDPEKVVFHAHADTTVTLGVHNIAHFFVLASRTHKNTSTPPQKT